VTRTLGAAPQDRDPAAVQRRTMIVLIVMQVVGTVGVGIAPSIGILLAGEVTHDEAWAGLARTASTLGAALVGLPLGSLAASQGRRVALSTGWWTAAAGSGLLVIAAQAGLVVPLFAGLLLIGVGSAVSLQARFAATDLAAPRHQGRSLALIVWVGTIGSVLGPNLGVPGRLVGERLGLNVYAGAFLIAAVCLALAGLVVFVWLRPDPLALLQRATPSVVASSATSIVTVAGTTATTRAAGGLRPWGRRRGGRDPARLVLTELRGNPAARVAVVAILTAQVVMVAIMTMTPVHMMHQSGSITLVGITISLHILGMYALSPVVGHLADRRGHRFAILLGAAILVISLVLGASLPHSTRWIIVSLVLLGIGWSFINVAGSALFSLVVSDRTRASSQGGVDAMANLCGATAAFVAGPLLAVSSFSALSVLAVVVLVPLGALILRPARGVRT